MFDRNHYELSLVDKHKVEIHLKNKVHAHLHILSILSTASVDSWFI